MSNNNRQSKSPLRSFLNIFKKEDEGTYTPMCLGDQKNKAYYDKDKKRWVFEGETAPVEAPALPPPKAIQKAKTDQPTVHNEPNLLAPPQNALQRAKQQQKKAAPTRPQQQAPQMQFSIPNQVVEETSQAMSQNPPQIIETMTSEPIKQLENIEMVQQQDNSMKLATICPDPTHQDIKKQPCNQQTQLQYEQNELKHQMEMQQLHQQSQLLAQMSNQLKSELEAKQYQYESIIQQQQQQLDGVKQLLVKFIPFKYFSIPQGAPQQLQKLISYQLDEPNKLQCKTPNLYIIPQQQLPNDNKVSQYLYEIVNILNVEINDYVIIVKEQSKELQIKSTQLGQCQAIIAELVKKLEEFVVCTQHQKKQIDSHQDQRNQLYRVIQQHDFTIKQQDLQIRNTIKEKETIKKQYATLQKERDQYAKYYEDLKRDYEEEMQMMTSQLEQSQLMQTELEEQQINEIKDQFEREIDDMKEEQATFKAYFTSFPQILSNGLKFIADLPQRSIDSEIDLENILLQYKREYNKVLFQKEQNHSNIITELKNQVFQSNLTFKGQQQQISQLEKQLAQEQQKIFSIKQESELVVQDYENQIQQLISDKDNLHNNLNLCEEQLHTINLQISNYQNEIKQVTLQSQLELQDTKRKFDNERTNPTKQIEEIKQKTNEQKAIILELESINKQLTNEITTVQEELQQFQSKVEQQLNSIEQLEYQLNSQSSLHEQQIIQINSDFDVIKQKQDSEIAELMSLKVRLEQETQCLQDQITQILEQNQQQSNEQEVIQLREQIQQNIKDIEELSNIVTQQNSDFNQLQECNDKLTTELSTLQQLYDKKEIQVNETVIIIQEQATNIQNKESQLDQIQGQLGQVTAQNEQLQQQIQELTQQLEDLQQVCQNKEHQYQNLVQEQQQQQQVQQPNTDTMVESLTKQVEELMQQLSQVDEANQQLQYDNEQLEGINQELTSQLTHSVNHIANQRSNEYDSVQAKEQQIHLLNQNIDALTQQLQEFEDFKHLYAQKVKLVEEQKHAIQNLEAQLSQIKVDKAELQQSEQAIQDLIQEKTQILKQLNDVQIGGQTQLVVDQQKKIQLLQEEFSLLKITSQQIINDLNGQTQQQSKQIEELNERVMQIQAQRDDLKEQIEAKQPQKPIQPPPGFLGSLASFFATESELKKLAQG